MSQCVHGDIRHLENRESQNTTGRKVHGDIRHLETQQAAIEVADVEYNDGLNGYIVELKDGRIVQVQFERETNRLHADYNTYFAFIDKENDYGLDLSDEEEELFYDWLRNNEVIQDKIKELDAA